MNRRSYILIAVMAIAFVAMVWFITLRNEMPMGDIRRSVLFGILLVGIALISVRQGSWVGVWRLSTGGWAKYLLGSFALACASWALTSLLLLSLIGYAGFELLQKPWFGAGLFLLVLCFFPLTRRFMK